MLSQPLIKALPLKVDDLLVDIYYHIRNSVNTIVSLKEFAEFCCVDFKSILKHYETRWLSLQRAIDRTLDMWDPLLSYFTSHDNTEKPGKLRTIFLLMSKLYSYLCQNLLLRFGYFSFPMCLQFLTSGIPSFKVPKCQLINYMNTFFQSSLVSTPHKLHDESTRLLKTVFSFFISHRSLHSTQMT